MVIAGLLLAAGFLLEYIDILLKKSIIGLIVLLLEIRQGLNLYILGFEHNCDAGSAGVFLRGAPSTVGILGTAENDYGKGGDMHFWYPTGFSIGSKNLGTRLYQ